MIEDYHGRRMIGASGRIYPVLADLGWPHGRHVKVVDDGGRKRTVVSTGNGQWMFEEVLPGGDAR